MKGKVRRREVERLGGEGVEEVGSGAKGSNPESGRNTGLKQKGANDIISGMDNSFSFTVLGRSVWAGHAQLDAVSEEEGAGTRVIELAAIVALNSLDGDTKLCAHVREEVRKSRKSVRFKAQRKSPQEMRTVIKNNQVIFVA